MNKMLPVLNTMGIFERNEYIPHGNELVPYEITFMRIGNEFIPTLCWNLHKPKRCKPFIPSRHIHSIIKHLVYYTTLGIVKINIFEHFKKYLNSTHIFLETDNNFTQ